MGFLQDVDGALNDPWEKLMNPGKTVKNEYQQFDNLAKNPTDIGNMYKAFGASSGFMPSPTAAISNKWGDQVQAQDQARANFDPYGGIPQTGGTLSQGGTLNQQPQWNPSQSPWTQMKAQGGSSGY